jgi:hypothetical protein
VTLPEAAFLLPWLGVVVTGALALVFLYSPAFGMAQAQHRAEQLPVVMTDRYFAFLALAFGAAFYRDLAVTSFLFAVFAAVSFADALIYRRAGTAYWKHFAAGLAAALVAGVALAALSATGGSV